MATMKAVQVKEPGDASQLYIGDYPKPAPKPDEILVKTKSFCLNQMDVSQRHGRYPPPAGASPILGVELSGIVEEVGAEVEDYKPGDKVFGLVSGGGYAEYAVVNHKLALPLPPHLTFQQGASIPEVWFTAYQALHFVAEIKAGDVVLVHAGASGVGTSVVQLARLAGAKDVFVTAGSEEKINFCKQLGATEGFNYKNEDWEAKVLEHTERRGVDIVIDFIGKDYWHKNISALARDGRMVVLAFMSGTIIEKVDLAPFLAKRLRVEGSGLRTRTIEYQSRLREAIQREVVPRIDTGELRLVIGREFGWSQIQEAHRYLESSAAIGKVVVNID